MGNPFQDAAVELNCSILGFKTPAGKPDAQRLKTMGGGQNIRFLNAGKDCEVGDENDPVQVIVPGYGHFDGANLEAAVAGMVKRICGATQTVAQAAAADAKRARRK